MEETKVSDCSHALPYYQTLYRGRLKLCTAKCIKKRIQCLLKCGGAVARGIAAHHQLQGFANTGFCNFFILLIIKSFQNIRTNRFRRRGQVLYLFSQGNKALIQRANSCSCGICTIFVFHRGHACPQIPKHIQVGLFNLQIRGRGNGLCVFLNRRQSLRRYTGKKSPCCYVKKRLHFLINGS